MCDEKIAAKLKARFYCMVIRLAFLLSGKEESSENQGGCKNKDELTDVMAIQDRIG